MRAMRIATLTCLLAVAYSGVASAQSGPDNNPTANGGNSVVNSGEGSGTGTTSPGPGMTLKDGKNPSPSPDPIANGGNTDLNKGAGSGTGTKEPAGTR